MPTPFTLHFQVMGEEEVEHRMLGIEQRAVNMRPALARIAELMRDAERETFETEGHGTWEKLATSTLLSKAALGYDPSILIATGDLVSSLTEEGGDHVSVITDDELHFSTSVPYAGFHQTGTSRMPARKPVMFTQADIRGFTREVQRFLVGEDSAAVRAAGGGNAPPGLK